MNELKQKLLGLGVVYDNEYLDLYCLLVKQNLSREKEKHKTQLHHTVPCALYASRAEANADTTNVKVNLLFKDHILAHYYLCLCASDSVFRYKMIASIEFTLGSAKSKSNTEIAVALKLWLKNDAVFQAAYEEYAELRSKRLHTPEVREKARQAMLGRSHSEEARRKISEKHQGKKLSADTRAKISKAHKGKPAWNIGKPSNVIGRKVVYLPDTMQIKYVLPEQIPEYLECGWLEGNPKVRGRSTGTRSRSIRCIETNEVFDMIKLAALAKGIGSTSLLQCLKGRSKTAGGYHWEYV